MMCEIVQVKTKTKEKNYFFDKISIINDAIKLTTIFCRKNVNNDIFMLSIHFKSKICDVQL